MTVRPAVGADAGDLARLRIAMDAEEGVACPAGFAERFHAWFEAEGHRFDVVVAEAGGRPVGMLWLERMARVPRPSEPEATGLGYVTAFYVEPERRGRGLGRALLDAVADIASANGVGTLIGSPSERSEPLWRRAGYGPTSFLEREG